MGNASGINPGLDENVRNYDYLAELGQIGQKKYGGIFYEEFLDDLRGKRGIEAYREMADNDEVVGAILFAIKMLVRNVKFEIEKAGNTEADEKAKEFVESCLDDMEQNWQDIISEILSFLTYGWSLFEIVYKRRMGRKKDRKLNSKHEDGLIGWRKLAPRAQDTLYQWLYDEEDYLEGFRQLAPPDFQIKDIPIEKCLHFVTESVTQNPEGRSILRNAYKPFYFKRRFQTIEGIGVERDLAGLPLIQPKEGVNLWSEDDPEMQKLRASAEMLVKNIRRNEKEGVVLPWELDLKLLNSGSKRQFEIGTIIERYDKRMAMTVMADFIMLGHEGVGSFALSSDKTRLFSVAIGTFLQTICDVFNKQGIPRLIDMNAAHFKGITDYPKMVHGDVEDKDIMQVANYLKEMIGMGLITPDENLEQFARRIGNLPERVDGAEFPEEYDDVMDDELDGGNEKTPPQPQRKPTEARKGKHFTVKPDEKGGGVE